MEEQRPEHFSEKYASDNSEYTSPSSLQYRLSPEMTIAQIEKELRGGYHESIIHEGQEKLIFRETGIALLNNFGLQAVMRRLRAIINSSTVQGNMSEDDFRIFMEDFHNHLAIELMGNKYEYGINSNGDLKSIINTITYFVRLFLSRTIGDGEREAMKVISKETYRDGELSQKKRGLLGF